MTASAFEEDKIKAIENGCNDFVRKPFLESDIFEMMEKHLGLRFVYEDEVSLRQPSTTKQISDLDLHSVMTPIPVELLTKLAEATNLCDAEKIDQIINDIHARNADLGDALASLSEKFAYDEIFNLINNQRKLNRHAK